jgi:ribosomal protein S27AE
MLPTQVSIIFQGSLRLSRKKCGRCDFVSAAVGSRASLYGVRQCHGQPIFLDSRQASRTDARPKSNTVFLCRWLASEGVGIYPGSLRLSRKKCGRCGFVGVANGSRAALHDVRRCQGQPIFLDSRQASRTDARPKSNAVFLCRWLASEVRPMWLCGCSCRQSGIITWRAAMPWATDLPGQPPGFQDRCAPQK